MDLAVHCYNSMSRPRTLAAPGVETRARFRSPYSVRLQVGSAQFDGATDLIGHLTFPAVPAGHARVTVKFLDQVELPPQFGGTERDLTPGDCSMRIVVAPDRVPGLSDLVLKSDPTRFYGWAYPVWRYDGYERSPHVEDFSVEATPKGPPFPEWPSPFRVEPEGHYPWEGGMPAAACTLSLMYKGRTIHAWDHGFTPGADLVVVPDVPAVRAAFRAAARR